MRCRSKNCKIRVMKANAITADAISAKQENTNAENEHFSERAVKGEESPLRSPLSLRTGHIFLAKETLPNACIFIKKTLQ